MDKEKLAKILALTASQTDGEALAALRMANKMLSAENLTWGDILKAGGTTINISLGRRPMSENYEGEAADWAPPHLTDRVLIEAMFRAIYAQPRSDNDSFWEWIDSVHQQWLDRGRLTPDQFNGVRRSHARALLRGAAKV